MPTKEGKANTCFVAGTKIHTQTGLKNIEDIQIGDVVLSWNEVTGERELSLAKTNLLDILSVILDKYMILETRWIEFNLKKVG
jgi:hypothetical protein